MTFIPDALTSYLYRWPQEDMFNSNWKGVPGDEWRLRNLDEKAHDLEQDSRWPVFFPSPLCFVTSSFQGVASIEKVVGASIVNRFPYILALSFCKKELSNRHYQRRQFMDLIESAGSVAAQFVTPGAETERLLKVIHDVPDCELGRRMDFLKGQFRPGASNPAPVMNESYLVYEGKLVRPNKDFDGERLFEKPWMDCGSHRIYFLEVNAIQLRKDIANGESQICWRSLPAWHGTGNIGKKKSRAVAAGTPKYQKGYNPEYRFPATSTVAFAYDFVEHGMAIRHLPPLPEEQVEVDNDRARWPCFFPQSVGMITSWGTEEIPNLMPCGSTFMVSRHPLIIAPCVSYARINERYAARASVELIRKQGYFGCGVPYLDSTVVEGIKIAGNLSFADNPDKVKMAGYTLVKPEFPWHSPILSQLPIHMDCKVVGELKMGTHVLFLGQIEKLLVHSSISAQQPLEWMPWPFIEKCAV